MAMIRQRGKSWQATVKRKGYPNQVKAFTTQAPAKAWARRIEASMDDGSWIDTSPAASALLSPYIDDILDEYLDSYKQLDRKVAKEKLTPINQLKEYFAGQSIHDITQADIVAFARMRRKTVNQSTLQKQMTYLQAAVKRTNVKFEGRVVERAVKYLADEKMIGDSESRERRVMKDIPATADYPERIGEYRRFKAASLKYSRAGSHVWMMLAVDLAIITGMRMGEIYSLRISDGRPLTAHTVPFGEGYIDFGQRLIGLWRKNKKKQKGKKFHLIPLWDDVREVILRAPNKFGEGDALFKVDKQGSIGDRFAKICAKAGIVGLTFHDLRHEATSRMFEAKAIGGRGMSCEQVIVVTGHASLAELQTYTNLRAEDLVDY
jgi:integrase